MNGPRVNAPLVGRPISQAEAEELTEQTDATVIAELKDGRTLILRNAWHAGEAERNVDAGSMVVRFEGLGGEEMNA